MLTPSILLLLVDRMAFTVSSPIIGVAMIPMFWMKIDNTVFPVLVETHQGF
jgi:hypothetical protein